MKRIILISGKQLLTLVMAAMLFALLACAPKPALHPAIQISLPADGSTLPTGDVTLSVNVSGFNLVDKLSQASAAGEGHIHYYLDVDPPTTPGQPAVTADDTYAATIDIYHTWVDVSPGLHTLGAQLVNNDHTPLNDPVAAEVTVTLSGDLGQSTTRYLNAQSVSYNTDTITVSAGSTVTVVFSNEDNITHNLAIYKTEAAGEAIFIGEIIGQKTVIYQFTAAVSPGTYFFRCDVHPTFMTGDFVVINTGF